MPRVSVVIPTLNNAATLAATLAALAGQADEVIVVDDASTDGTAEVARRAGAHVIAVSRRSAAHARNVGVDAAKGDIVLFTDADAIPRAGWARALARALERADIAGGAIALAEPASSFARLFHKSYLALDARGFRDGSDHLPAMNLGARRAVFDRVRFRDAMPGAESEDVDFLMRTKAAGLSIRFAPDAVVAHHQPDSWRAMWEQELRHGRGRARLHALHPELKHALVVDRAWKWWGSVTLGAPVHLARAAIVGRTFDPRVWVIAYVRQAAGDRGYVRAARDSR
ncbi:MAG: glycosyltransferase family 2 protein [Thermoplasmatota archaeon]